MAIYKIFPIKDSSITSEYPQYNYGRDEILSINAGNSISRALIQFENNEINELISSISGSYSASLKLYNSEISNISENYDIEICALSQSWIMGTGRNGDSPNPLNGVCWDYPNPYDSQSLWSGGGYINYSISQSFNYQSSKDIDYDITPIVNDWYNNTIINNGLLLKYPNIIESSSNNTSISFFSIDTHTIYPPHLEFSWVDTFFSTSLSIINNNEFKSSITNLKSEYDEDSIYTFIIKNRDIYPARQFQSNSLYLNNKSLPSSSYWALKDVKTNEIVIDYNNMGTKIGSNNNGNYFTLYMNGLQPERYYQILIKTIINDDIIIIDNPSNYFKIVR